MGKSKNKNKGPPPSTPAKPAAGKENELSQAGNNVAPPVTSNLPTKSPEIAKSDPTSISPAAISPVISTPAVTTTLPVSTENVSPPAISTPAVAPPVTTQQNTVPVVSPPVPSTSIVTTTADSSVTSQPDPKPPAKSTAPITSSPVANTSVVTTPSCCTITTPKVTAPPPTPINLKCPVCQKSASSKCGGCSKIAYCSREHQKIHWKIHKGDCGLYKICENNELGRHLVAVREIKPGKVILQENPLLLTSPRITCPICLGCYSEFLAPDDESNQPGDEDLKPVPCPNGCGWPMCNSEECRKNRADHEAECKISLDRGSLTIRHYGGDHPMYQAVGILRALSLKDTNPQAYNQLLSLQSNDVKREEMIRAQKAEAQEGEGEGENPDETIIPPPDISMTISLIRDFFKQDKNGVTEELIRKISGILETNGHEIPIPGNFGQITRRLIGVYNEASFLEHNCVPNCVKTWDSKTKAIIIRCSVTINKGDHLAISYVDPLWGTNDRQNFLQMTKFFTCQCKRCLDPTELNQNISSIRCQQIQCTTKWEAQEKIAQGTSSVGMIVPLDPLNPSGDWKCATCNEVYPVHYPSSIVERIGRDVVDFQPNRGDIAAEEEFIRKFARVLAPNHFYLLEIKVELAQLIGRTASEPLPVLPPQKLLRKINLCEELLKVFNVILPGYNRLRSLILYELQAALGTLSKVKYSVGDISTKSHIEELLACRIMLMEVVKVLAWEPDLSVEYRRCQGAKIELKDLEGLIETMKELQVNLSLFTASPKNPSSSQAQGQTSGFTASSSSGSGVPPASNNLMIKSAEFDDDELELF